ncbi:MAG: type II toxin-antitoxin system VapB family antitoxin [Deltaproteobacteria bacterium]|nr:type II toxin-antitoxin system VapB family antitoxin [Deltaproteobacteria bacterium]
MKTLLTIPEELLGTARTLSGARTKSETVSRALQEYVRFLRQDRLLARKGKGFSLSQARLEKLRRMT